MSTNSWIEWYRNCVAEGSFWENAAMKNIDDNIALKKQNKTLSEENEKLLNENLNLAKELDSLKEEHHKTMAEACAKDSMEIDSYKKLNSQLVDDYLRLFKEYTNRGDRIIALQKELKETKEKHDISDEEVKRFLLRLYNCFVGSTANDTGLDCIASYTTLSSFTDAFSNLYTLIDDIVFDEHFYDVIYDFLEWARKDYYNKMIEKVSKKEESANKEDKYENHTTEV